MSAPARYAVRLLMLLPLAACGEEGAQPDTRAYVELLNKHSFRNVAAFDLTPVHAVTHGQK